MIRTGPEPGRADGEWIPDSLAVAHTVAEAATPRILIAEDNRDEAESLKLLLKGLGYEAHAVNDGESAVRAASDLRPHVILMDIGLPGVNGYDAARQIRAQSPDMQVRIVALTGLHHQIDRQRSAEAGIDHHLVKPLDLAVLQPILDMSWRPGAG
jgi:CheY-like chemotaxis protein